MNITKYKSAIMILIAVLWLLCMILGWTNNYVIAMCLGVILMFLHMMIGTAKNGIISKKFFIYPIVLWAVLWIIAFVLAEHYSVQFAGRMPDFTILGFHPSFAMTILPYWFGGMLTLNLGLYLFKDEWLSQKDWDDFKKRVNANKEDHRV